MACADKWMNSYNTAKQLYRTAPVGASLASDYHGDQTKKSLYPEAGYIRGNERETTDATHVGVGGIFFGNPW